MKHFYIVTAKGARSQTEDIFQAMTRADRLEKAGFENVRIHRKFENEYTTIYPGAC